VLAYVAFRLAIVHSKGTVHEVRGARQEESEFSFGTIVRDIGHVRHLQVIVGIMVVMYLVDTIVEYQFQVTARQVHRGDQLTAFFGQFYGLYLNLTEFVFQLFVTASVVRRFGVGGTLQISPVSILLASIATVVAPGVTSASAVRLTEASTRYTLNRTGMELLYMPLPQELRNRIKAFIDICVDRLSRGIGGVLLLLLTATSLKLGVKGIAVVVMVLCVPWIYLSYIARREYVATIRRRFESRRLDFESARVPVSDAATIRFLEDTVDSENPRQAAYALELLGDAPGYDVQPLLERTASSPHPEVRSKAYQIATTLRYPGLKWGKPPLLAEEVQYAIAISQDRRRLAADFLEEPDPAVASAVLETLRQDRVLAEELLTPEWFDRVERSEDPRRRALAIRAAGVLKDRTHLFRLVQALGNPRQRGDAIAALAEYGPQICGSLSDVLLDESVPVRVRRQVPRVLKKIPHQRSVDVLIGAIGHPDLSIRASVLKALNHLRETAPDLKFENDFVTRQILNEARYYYELSAALEPFRARERRDRTAAELLAATIEERLRRTLERLFRLLGLRYPPKEIYSAYLAVSRKAHEEATAALEFLDNTLERDLKRFLLPLLDAPENLLEHGRELFGVKSRTAEEAIRELIRSHDPWLSACAMAAAAELGLRSLVPEIQEAASAFEEEVGEVARAAEAQLAA
jgi:AAA family ATP:ADP antiporter